MTEEPKLYAADDLLVGGPAGVERHEVDPAAMLGLTSGMRLAAAVKAAVDGKIRTPAQALAWARDHDHWKTGMCLQFVRSCYGVPPLHPTAAVAWAATKRRHTSTPPAGVPVWWTGGRRGYGHVAISAGSGRIISTDVPSQGRVGLTTIDALTRAWGHHYVGWSEDINGYRVTTADPEQEDDDMFTDKDRADLKYTIEQNETLARTIVKLAEGLPLTPADLTAVKRAASGK